MSAPSARRIALGLLAAGALALAPQARAEGARSGAAADLPREDGLRRTAPRPQGEGATERPPETADDPSRAPVDATTRRAVERALDWLAARQAEEPDGSFPPVGAEHPAPLAVTSLATLAFLSAGEALDRGPHGQAVARAVDYLLDHVDRAPDSPFRGYVSDARDSTSRTHGHGFATLALAEAWSVSPHSPRGARMREAIGLSVECIERSQALEGGWYYEPVRGLEHEGSVTICLVQALRSAKNAGFRVDPEVIARAVDYVHRSQNEDGSFRYALGSKQTSVALTAAAIATLNASGRYSGASITQGYDSLERELALRATADARLEGPASDFPHYERLYLAQAYWQHPDPRVWRRWSALELADLLASQRPDGSFGGSRYGDCYATAMSVLVLTLPDGLLPIFQR